MNGLNLTKVHTAQFHPATGSGHQWEHAGDHRGAGDLKHLLRHRTASRGNQSEQPAGSLRHGGLELGIGHHGERRTDVSEPHGRHPGEVHASNHHRVARRTDPLVELIDHRSRAGQRECLVARGRLLVRHRDRGILHPRRHDGPYLRGRRHGELRRPIAEPDACYPGKIDPLNRHDRPRPTACGAKGADARSHHERHRHGDVSERRLHYRPSRGRVVRDGGVNLEYVKFPLVVHHAKRLPVGVGIAKLYGVHPLQVLPGKDHARAGTTVARLHLSHQRRSQRRLGQAEQ